tara:strand:- start:29 stop:1345 length:1317 start_codon:yes stop_codon:yes gene_type:complete
MNRIDFIIKNFQAANFLKDLKKEISSGWGEDEVLKNYIDFNDLEYQLNYLKLSKADIPKKVDAYLHGNLDIKKLILDFFKKKLPINKNTLNKYFIKKNVFNLSGHEFNFCSDADDLFDTTYEIKDALKNLIYEGVFFQKIKEYKLIFTGQINFKRGNYQYSIICFYSFTDRKYHLVLFFLEEDGNDQYHYISSFNKKPNLDLIKKFINKKSKKLFFYSTWKNDITSYFITPINKKIHLSKYFIKECKKGLNEKRTEKKIIRIEDDFFRKYENVYEIKTNYIKYKPEIFYKNDDPIDIINQHFKIYPSQKFKNFRFFKFLMSEKFKYKYDPKFIIQIIHSKEDLEGLLSFLPLKTLQDKNLSEEIRILRMLRSKDKNFLIKVFKTNKDKLYDLATNYMPKSIFNDKKLVLELVKLDTDIISLIGEKLKKDKKFMKKIWE